MIIKNAQLETVCGPTSTLPMNTLPEVAFAGRSNVGKSSLINVLMQRKSLARTSSKPGKTQTINYYRVDCAFGDDAHPSEKGTAHSDLSGAFYLVDLPGYGYAKRSKEQTATWGPMIERYLKRTAQLRALFLLVDVRLKPQESDLQMIAFTRHIGRPLAVIATKADKLKKNEIQKQKEALQKGLALEENEPLILFSATAKTGREDICDLIASLISD